jgi:hypothetical protein
VVVVRRRLDEFVDHHPSPLYADDPASDYGKNLHHVSTWVRDQLSATVADRFYLAMVDSAFALRSANVARRRLQRIANRTAHADEIADAPQIAEFEAMRAATSAYASSLHMQAAALAFGAGVKLAPGKHWPSAGSTAHSKLPTLVAWHKTAQGRGRVQAAQ